MEVGERYGRGTVIETGIRVTHGKSTRPGVRLQCECGNVYEAWHGELKERNGRINTQSCGCALKDHIRRVRGPGHHAPKTHGMSEHPLYGTWAAMLQRCENPEFHKYPRYGGRGIKVCERWHDVRLFIEDIERELGPRPPRHTLDRKDNDGDYEPGKVRWATPRQQAINKPRQGSSQYRGVQYIKSQQRWTSRVHLGKFTSEEEAAAVYQRAVEILEREGILR